GGRCFCEHVGVNAPGSVNITTFLPANSAAGSTSEPPSGVACLMVTDGILVPVLIMAIRYHRRALRAGTCAPCAADRLEVRHPRSPRQARCTGPAARLRRAD